MSLERPGKFHLNPDEPTDEYPMYGVTAVPKKQPGKIRVWVDGCFDMLHFGHTNAIRQARALGDELFIGIHSDEEVARFKGPPIMSAEERYEAARGCKWVDFVVENYPYVTRVKDMHRFEIDFVVHGDDISTDQHGNNSYQAIIDAGLMKVVKRTDGISTTDLVGRMLLCAKSHHLRDAPEIPTENLGNTKLHYLTTSRKIAQFSNNRVPAANDVVVYVDGGFDLFHVGHMRILQKAKEFGTYIICGIHEDEVINHNKGANYPIMNMNERVLGVLSCRYVDEVVMGVPYAVTEDLIKSLGVHVVVAGIVATRQPHHGEDPYAVPKRLGIFHEVESGCELTTETIIQRIVDQRMAFLERQKKKIVKDAAGELRKPKEYQNVREV